MSESGCATTKIFPAMSNDGNKIAKKLSACSAESPSSSESSGDEASASKAVSDDQDNNVVSPNPLQTIKAKPDAKGKEENIFSFKKFLQSDNSTNYQSTGARPKVYDQIKMFGRSRPAEPVKNHETGKFTRNPTELPDFVQDHLVLEQCFLKSDTTNSEKTFEWNNLPDFALNSEQSVQVIPENSKNVSKRVDPVRYNKPPNQLGPDNPPVDIMQNSTETLKSTPKLLPDFLTDAPICRGNPNRLDYIADSMNFLARENEKLKSELQMSKWQTVEQQKRITALETVLSSKRQSDQAEKTIEQVEDDLKRSTRRAINSERSVASLQRIIESLTMENSRLLEENRELKTTENLCVNCRNINPNRKCQKLSEDLRSVASSAETSLRQLMAGVNNLRILASTLETATKAEDHQAKDFLQESDEDNAAGPAL